MRYFSAGLIAFAAAICATVAQAQVDPKPRSLLHFGYNQPLQGKSSLAGYAFYYLNKPKIFRNANLRFALAPVYIDSELGFKGALGENVDLGLSAAGGGFADSHTEIRKGAPIDEESFIGHGGELGLNLYALLNPEKKIPLHLVVKGSFHGTSYRRDSSSPESFAMPKDHTKGIVRTGLRLAGREPQLFPRLGMEISAWYQGEFRLADGTYGFAGDRRLNKNVHQFWSWSSLDYTFPKYNHNLNLTMALGTGLYQDRLNVHRLGGRLPFIAEFPLDLPGYFFQEISAKDFALFGSKYLMPLGKTSKWGLSFFGNHAQVNYLDGLEQPDRGHTGVGTGISYVSTNNKWKIHMDYLYGLHAMRADKRGAHAIGLLVQYDIAASQRGIEKVYEPEMSPKKSKGFDRTFRRWVPR
ncbi:MAG: hypothetical protein A2901_06720 [Elusimicrobia bacterium RIFCSPLOWO2_01_FULL_54_10]|nr:MAG: hypothetical protein A2901_06720 [Elusimicrobia bacterium RIFCSPLOWO2_01_FULL_54_10]